MPQTANKDTEEEHVFFMLACVQHECILHKFRHWLDPNPAVIGIEDWGGSLVLHKLHTNMELDLYI